MTGTVLGRITMAVIGCVVLGCTFESVRRGRLLERYAILWMLTSLVTLICAAFPFVPNIVVGILKISFLEAASLIIFFFFLMVTFHMSLAISRIQSDEQATARRTALLEAEIECLRHECDLLKGRFENVSESHASDGKSS